MATRASSPSEPKRTRDPVRTRAEILAVATEEFAAKGYTGARVDEIAERIRTTKRMIYYYFGSKEQLFTAVLEHAYAEIRLREQQLAEDEPDPVAALRRLVELTFDHHEAHPDFIRLVSIENIHRAEHMAASETLGKLNHPAIEVLSRILAAGRERGVFRADVDPIDLHAMISSYCFFRIANRHTFQALFDRDLAAPEDRDRYRTMLAEMIVSYLRPEAGPAQVG
ncbi:TetR/AcrR family transcriptional regulator [Phaeacidiphilus oryzae]|uniref:TetR/AcrR family transcriptional regulator n=1 Tax=Phaeacidiphilus oryzae TaxID=348818 RepID=UPI00056097B4|nr:TetR/AcrR family transcriptional regulator [Phaeacidiphilus oryzae]